MPIQWTNIRPLARPIHAEALAAVFAQIDDLRDLHRLQAGDLTVAQLTRRDCQAGNHAWIVARHHGGSINGWTKYVCEHCRTGMSKRDD
jgi:hypothetical protein